MTSIIPVGDRVLRPKEASKKSGLCLSHLYALSSENKFPKPIRLVPGGRASGFLESEVNRWIAGRVAERDGGLTLLKEPKGAHHA